MKLKRILNKSVTKPLLKALMDRDKLNNKQNPTVGDTPLKPANLYQDAGSGYNSNFTFPQI